MIARRGRLRVTCGTIVGKHALLHTNKADIAISRGAGSSERDDNKLGGFRPMTTPRAMRIQTLKIKSAHAYPKEKEDMNPHRPTKARMVLGSGSRKLTASKVMETNTPPPLMSSMGRLPSLQVSHRGKICERFCARKCRRITRRVKRAGAD